MSDFTISTRPERPEAADGPEGIVFEIEPFSPTLTHYQRLADEFVAALDNLIAVLPKLEQPHPSTAAFVRGHRTVPVPFMETAVAGIARNPELQAMGRNADEARDTLQLNEAFRPVVDRVRHFGEDLKFTLDSRMALLGADALQVYYLAKGLGRRPDGGHMLQLVEDLKRDLGPRGPKKGARKKKAA